MPWNVKESAGYSDKEILKYPQMGLVKKSVVLDGNAFAVGTTGARFQVPAGTPLKRVGDKHVAYDGSGTVAGILARPVDILLQATAGSEPAPMYFHEAVFTTLGIVGFTQYLTAIVTALPTCKFD